MYVELPYKTPKPFDTKAQAIRFLKNHKNKKFRRYASDKQTIKFIMNRHKMYLTTSPKIGLYVEVKSEWSDVASISNEFYDKVNIYPEIDEKIDCFGVCDSVKNFLDIFDEKLKNSGRKYFVCFVPLTKEEQPKFGGWRWCKWGEYIGTQNQTAEYLYDELYIKKVML
jgi:hypothetical protein